jgi:D-lactate dehydrogenase (cytochrome)
MNAPAATPETTRHPALPELTAALRELLGPRCSTSESEREHHGHGESYHPTKAPDPSATRRPLMR